MNAPLPLASLVAGPAAGAARWAARLELEVACREGRTVPVVRRHLGPLRLLKGYRHRGPDRDCWEQIVVHPPGGIAAGDTLDIRARAGAGSHLLLTAPGAAKWYRGRAEADARQLLRLEIEPGGHLEWMPMETIVYDGARVAIENNLHVREGASLIAGDLVCLGRPAGALPFRRGSFRQVTRLVVDGRTRFIERTHLDGGQSDWRGPPGLGDATSFGSLLVVPANPDTLSGLVAAMREAIERAAGDAGDAAVTALPGLAIVRWRGGRAEHGWRALRAAWAAARPVVNGMPADPPRIWSC